MGIGIGTKILLFSFTLGFLYFLIPIPNQVANPDSTYSRMQGDITNLQGSINNTVTSFSSQGFVSGVITFITEGFSMFKDTASLILNMGSSPQTVLKEGSMPPEFVTFFGGVLLLVFLIAVFTWARSGGDF
jgi:hypothetical protein